MKVSKLPHQVTDDEEVGRQHQGMDRPGVRQVPEGSGEQGKMETTGCKIICGAPTTLAVKGLMMMIIMMHPLHQPYVHCVHPYYTGYIPSKKWHLQCTVLIIITSGI